MLVSCEEHGIYERNPLFYQLYLAKVTENQLEDFYSANGDGGTTGNALNDLLDAEWWTNDASKMREFCSKLQSKTENKELPKVIDLLE
jgi:hypothetical protein